MLRDSVSFDRAAGFYDRTRALSEPVMTQLVAMLAGEIGDSGRCLEIGVGTGRIALPLARLGVEMVGVDISREMIRRLIHNGERTRVDVALADATKLPFVDGNFGSAIAAHVLHLIPRWRDAVDELMRVVRPHGKLLAERGTRERGSWGQEVTRRFYAEVGDPPWPPGLDDIEQLNELMQSRGAALRLMPDLVEQSTSTVNDLLASFEAGIFSRCWSLDDATRSRAAAATRAWAERKFGDLDEPREAEEVLTWRAYDLP